MIRVVTKEEIRDSHDLARASSASAGLASLRYVLFDRASVVPGPGTHRVLAIVSNEFDARARELQGFLA